MPAPCSDRTLYRPPPPAPTIPRNAKAPRGAPIPQSALHSRPGLLGCLSGGAGRPPREDLQGSCEPPDRVSGRVRCVAWTCATAAQARAASQSMRGRRSAASSAISRRAGSARVRLPSLSPRPSARLTAAVYWSSSRPSYDPRPPRAGAGLRPTPGTGAGWSPRHHRPPRRAAPMWPRRPGRRADRPRPGRVPGPLPGAHTQRSPRRARSSAGSPPRPAGPGHQAAVTAVLMRPGAAGTVGQLHPLLPGPGSSFTGQPPPPGDRGIFHLVGGFCTSTHAARIRCTMRAPGNLHRAPPPRALTSSPVMMVSSRLPDGVAPPPGRFALGTAGLCTVSARI